MREMSPRVPSGLFVRCLSADAQVQAAPVAGFGSGWEHQQVGPLALWSKAGLGDRVEYHQDPETGMLALVFGRWEVPGRSASLQRWFAAHQQEPKAAFRALSGRFIALLHDPRSARVWVATDRFATVPLSHRTTPEGLELATDPGLFPSSGSVPLALCPQALYEYLYFHMVPAPRSIYAGVSKLGPAQQLRWEQGAQEAQVEGYWMPRFEDQPHGRDRSNMEAALRSHLAEAVRASASTCSAAFLSGGLDSSTTTGLLAQARDGDVDAFSVGFEAEGYDEMPYARIAAQHFGVRHHELYLSPADVVRLVPEVAACYGEPFGNSSAVPTLFCAQQAAAAGHGELMAGDGGDELFAGNERYATQALFEHYARLPRGVRALVDTTDRCLSPVASHWPVSKLRRYVEQARVPLPDRLQGYNNFHMQSAAAILHPDLLGQVDLDAPLKLLRSVYAGAAAQTSLQRMLWLDWKQTLADNDLRKVTQMTQAAGVRVCYPMLAEPVVELATEIPPQWLLPKRRLRDFYKRVYADFLPPAILTKPKHGFGLPFGVWLQTDPGLGVLAGDALEGLKARNIVHPDHLDRLLKQHAADHAAYYGEQIWVLMMLELWLQAHGHR